jgi:hypothetical protein
MIWNGLDEKAVRVVESAVTYVFMIILSPLFFLLALLCLYLHPKRTTGDLGYNPASQLDSPQMRNPALS